MFLSANNFFWKIELRGRTMIRVAKWRDLGRPEAALLGVQYIANDMGESRGPWLVDRGATRSWIFRGVRLHRGTEFSNAGIEIDAVAAARRAGHGSSRRSELARPRADCPHDLLRDRQGRPGLRGRCVHARRARPGSRPVRRLLTNLWERLARVRGLSEAGLRGALPDGDALPARSLRGSAHRLPQYPDLRSATAAPASRGCTVARGHGSLDRAGGARSARRRYAGFDTRRPTRAPGDGRTMWLTPSIAAGITTTRTLDPRRPTR